MSLAEPAHIQPSVIVVMVGDCPRRSAYFTRLRDQASAPDGVRDRAVCARLLRKVRSHASHNFRNVLRSVWKLGALAIVRASRIDVAIPVRANPSLIALLTRRSAFVEVAQRL